MVNTSQIEKICNRFNVNGDFIRFDEIKTGNVNQTYRVFFENPNGDTKSYILQQVNTYAFHEPEKLMENVTLVSSHLKNKHPEKQTLHYYYTTNKDINCCHPYIYSEDGSFWRLFNYIDSVSYDSTDNLQIIQNAGQAFGAFQRDLADFEASKLHYTIPDFHNTEKRYQTFEKDVKLDSENRVLSAKNEIDGLLAFKEKACTLTRMQSEGLLPLRVTHNDTKLNNVLFDKVTGEAITVIDLDTVMPGLIAYDFGDAVRFAANKCAEDCPDPSLAEIDMDIYTAFTKGFLSETGSVLTRNEIDTLALSGFVVACELAVRFLDDYLTGDRYFNIDYEGHNLVRARCQLALARNMLINLGEMEEIIKNAL